MIALGFGCNEEKDRQDIKNAVMSAELAGQNIDDAVKPRNDKAKEYDAMPCETAPERYTSVYIYDGAFHFHHINRRHPFSPDGWALLQIDEPFEEKKDAPQDIKESVENSVRTKCPKCQSVNLWQRLIYHDFTCGDCKHEFTVTSA